MKVLNGFYKTAFFFRDHVSKYKIFDNKESFLNWVEENAGHHGGYYLALNPEKIFAASKDKNLNRILKTAQGLIVDGVGAKLAIQYVLSKKYDRVTGVDAMLSVLQVAQEKGLRVGFFGAKKHVLEKVKKVVEREYSGVRAVFFLSGYGEDKASVSQVLTNHPVDIVFVALGSPEQEKWIDRIIDQYPDVIFTGVGGSFDVLSGKFLEASVAASNWNGMVLSIFIGTKKNVPKDVGFVTVRVDGFKGKKCLKKYLFALVHDQT
ncbi:MAG: WecB/TagA/CpsF family glycosyltransferase [Bdellovibrionota bacterium]